MCRLNNIPPRRKVRPKNAQYQLPSKYQELLDKYKGVMECRYDDNPKHGIVHKKETNDSEPYCKTRQKICLETRRECLWSVVS